MFRTLFVAMLCISWLRGQAPSFDVASVRPSKIVGEGGRREKIDVNPGTVSLRNVSLKTAIRWAYHVMDYQITGPDWIGSERYDIAAKAATAASEDQLRLMMQTVLTERFKLAFHRQTKELPAYLLTVAKGGIKFQESNVEGEPQMNADKGRLSVEIKGMTAEKFVEALSNVLRAPVINNTGLTGKYDGKVDISKYLGDMPKEGSGPFDPTAMIITGLHEELGLKLESKKMPLDLLIVDHAEKVPVEN